MAGSNYNSKILKCSCEHKSQDELHGPGNRVMSRVKQSDGKSNKYRCSVCLKEREG